MTKNNNKEKTKSSFWNVFIILFFSYPLIYEFFGFYSDYKSFIKGGLFELVLGHIICFIPIMLIYIVLYISFKVTLEYYKKKKNFISYVKKLKEENIKYYDKPQKSQAISYNKPQKAKRISLEVFDKTKHKGLHYSAIKNIEQSVYGNIDPLKVKARKLNQQIKAKQEKKLAIVKGLKRTPIALGYFVFFMFLMFCVMLFSGLLTYIGVPSFISFFVFIFLMGYLINLCEKSLEKHFNKPSQKQGIQQFRIISFITYLCAFIACMVVTCAVFFGLWSLLGYTKLTLFDFALFVLFSAFAISITYQLAKNYLTKKQKELEEKNSTTTNFYNT